MSTDHANTRRYHRRPRRGIPREESPEQDSNQRKVETQLTHKRRTKKRPAEQDDSLLKRPEEPGIHQTEQETQEYHKRTSKNEGKNTKVSHQWKKNLLQRENPVRKPTNRNGSSANAKKEVPQTRNLLRNRPHLLMTRRSNQPTTSAKR